MGSTLWICFVLNDTATTDNYTYLHTLSLHDALPISNLAGTTGETTFNFEGESLQAVIKAILGDMLGQNYVIAPGVQGTVTYVTSRPVSPAEALSLLEMVLGWNNARMIYSDGRYNIVDRKSTRLNSSH